MLSQQHKEELLDKVKHLKDAYLELLKKIHEVNDKEDELYKKVAKALDQQKMKQVLESINKI